jgi:Mg-chelatase subunit ChlD
MHLVEGSESSAPVRRAEILQAMDFSDLAQRRAPDFTEMALLRLLERHVDWGSPALGGGFPRTLLVTRRASEQLAAPIDPRQHYAIKGRLAALDERWGMAFDEVLIGDDESLHRAGEELTALGGDGPAGYARAAQFSDHVRLGLQTRDAALAAAIAWNQWWIRRAEHELGVRDGADVPSLVDGALGLAACLDEMMGPKSSANAALERQLEDLTAQVANAQQRLLTAFEERLDAVTREEQGSRGLTAIETPELLKCGVGSAEGRLLLHDLWFKRLTGKDAVAGEAIGVGGLDSAAEANGELEYLRWVATKGVAPLRELLDERRYGVESDGTRAIATIDSRSTREEVDLALATLGEQMRTCFRNLDKQCQELTSRTSSAVTDQPASVAREGLSQADLRSRSLASITAGTPSVLVGGEALAGRLRALDSQAWILWHGVRALDDCWGHWQTSPDREEPYFAQMAMFAAAQAEELAADATFGPADLRRRTAEREQVVRQWQPLQTENLFVYDEGGGFKPHPLRFRAAHGMRSGEAAVFLADDRGELFRTFGENNREVRRLGALVQDDAVLQNSFELRSLADVPVLMANALFRGHVATARFSVGYGVRVDWERPAPQDASVVVRGDDKQISEIVFILDCSGSMDGRDFDHVKDGREVLKGILRRLARQGDQFRVALVVFGRRAGWSENPPGSPRRYDAKYLDPTSWRGAPGNDVERPIRLGLLNEQHANRINDFLETAKGNGETPLYYSLCVALDEFSANPGVSRHIVAITDGVDQVTKDDSRYPVNEFAPQDVLNRLAARPTRIDVVEFGIDESQFKGVDLKAGRDNLKTITGSPHSGGSWQQAEDTGALEEALLNSLKLDTYGLQEAGKQEPSASEFADLGAATLVPAPLAPKDFFVILESRSVPPAPIRVEGGEALELVYQRVHGNRLIYPIYEADKALSTIVDTSRGAFRLTPHTSDLTTSSEAIFHLSIQSGDERRFSRRPEVIWAKVTPQSRPGVEEAEPRSYYFVDREFQRGTTVPVLNLRAAGWPGNRAARVEVCFAPEAAPLRPTVLAIPGLGEAPADVEGVSLKAAMREIGGGGFEVVVDERHPRDAESFPLHLQLDPPADSVSHVYFEADGSAHHVYRYRSVNRPNPQLRVLTRRQIEEGDGGGNVTFEYVEFGRR